MSKADTLFIAMCKDILENGTTTEGQKVRPHWEDGTSAYTIKKFGVCNRYNLKEEFPALTLRRTALKSCMDEVLWIYQKKSNNINDLKSHIWDSWADETGSIGKAYGYQIAQRSSYPEGEFDQMDRVLYDLEHNPYSRRIMTNTYTYADLHDMHLYPCAYNVIYNVTQEPDEDKPTLNMMLIQRSQDILAANNWNVCQYALLLMMVAQVENMYAGELMHVIADAHIYDRHIDTIQELISRPTYPAPKVRLNPEITNFYDFTTDDLIVEDYQHGPQVKNIPVAIQVRYMSAHFHAIVAVCNGWAIGKDNQLLIHNKADMQHFVEKTTGHTVVMGRKTFESLPSGALKDRRNIVLTHNQNFCAKDIEVMHNLDETFAALNDHEDVWICGGQSIYRLFLPFCEDAWVTYNHVQKDADTHFPQLDAFSTWKLDQSIAGGKTASGIAFEFLHFTNTSVQPSC